MGAKTRLSIGQSRAVPGAQLKYMRGDLAQSGAFRAARP